MLGVGTNQPTLFRLLVEWSVGDSFGIAGWKWKLTGRREEMR